MTQSFSFREPEADPGQQVFTGPNMMPPWKQSTTAYDPLGQSDHAAMVNPGSSSDKGPRIRRWSDNAMQGMYVDQLQPHGRSVRLSTDSLQSSSILEQYCHPGGNMNIFGVNLTGADQSFPVDRHGGNYYTRMVERGSYGIPDTTNFMSTNSTPLAFGTPANGNHTYGNHDQVSSNGGRSMGVPGQAFANLQALLAHGRGGLSGMNASTIVAPEASSQCNQGAYVQAPAPYAPRAQLHSSASIFTTAGDRFSSHVWNQNGFENNSESVTLAFGNGLGGSGSWPDLLSCQSGTLENSTSQSANMFDSRVGVANDEFIRPQSPCTPRGHHQRVNTVLSDAQQEYLQEIDRLNSMAGEIPDTPHRNSRGRRLGYTAPAQPSSSGIFDSPVNPQADVANFHGLCFGSDIAQHVGPSTQGITVESAVSETTGITDAEQPQQDGIYSQTYEPQAPPMAAAGGGEIGDKGDLSGHKFDLNEVPGYAEAAPKRRKKYHPIVAKDKRTYKKRRVDGNYQNSPSKKPAVNVEHDTAVCDCEACIKVRLERRLHAGKKFRHGEQTRSSMDADSRHEVRLSTVAESMTLTSEARETIFNQIPDARNFGGADGVFSNAQSPVSPPERGSRSLRSPNSSSKSPSVRRNIFATQPKAQEEQAALSSMDVAAAESDQRNGSSSGAWSAHYHVGANLATLQEMVAQHRDITMAMSRRNLLYQELHSGSALSSSYGGVQPGAIVPARMNDPGLHQLEWNPGTYANSFDQIRSVCNTNNSFMSRLCPRGILSPQEVPFRNMNKIQRVVYLKSILISKRLEMTPESLLQHVHDHLPESEKEEFKSLWDFILTPVTNDQMLQLAQLAQMQLPAGVLTPQLQSECQTALEKRKTKAAKKPSRRELALSPKAMTLWSDLVQEQSNSKPVKERRRKASNVEHRQERQNSNGNIDSQGLEMVPFENKSMVPYEGPFNPLRKRKPRAKVVLDNETVRVWKLLMGKNGSQDNETDADKELKWDEERRKMKAQALRFIDRMHIVQGDRSFSCWKGSVVDSVVGAFLTQNVNDVLSSSAFMSMRSRFPGRGFRKQTEAPPEDTDVAESSESELVHPPPPATKTEESDQEPKISQEASSSYKPSEQLDIAVHSSEPPPNIILESQESRDEESCELLHIEEYQESTQESTPQEDQLPHEIALPAATASEISDSEHSQTAAKTSNSVSDNTDSGLEFQVVATTENAATTEESSGANNGNLLEVGSELVEGNQPSHGKYNPKTGLTGLERAKIEEKQVTARKSFDFSGLQEEFKPRAAGQERPAAPPRTEATADGVDWEAVRRAKVEEVADVIKERGLNWILAGRIKAFLERLHRDYGALDLEWLRSMSTDQTKEFLLSIRGLGLKSVECIRLLTLHHLAFPVDTNVGRICVRLGWVPLEPLPEELQLHLLELYPVQATIQKYLWPRLCKLDQATLYELHYQMITFGKVFCTKSKPNCNACPMRPECKHFASALSSAKLALPASERPNNGPTLALPPGTSTPVEETIPEASHPQVARPVSHYCLQPIVEEPMTPESEADVEDFDIEDYPFSVEEVDQEEAELMNMCMQKSNVTEPETIVASTISESEPVREIVLEEIGVNSDSCANTVINLVDSNEDEGVGDTLVGDIAPSQEMVLVSPGAASLPIPKLKNVGRLRTVHYVYELPDNHPLLDGLDPREADDPCTYLLAIWSPGEVPESIPNINDSVNEDSTFASSSSGGEESIKATLLVPCRTAMKGSFPLNGTYFQVNEVFADHESSLQPILVSRNLLWNLRRRFVFFGTTVTSIFRGMTVEEIQACFWRGYVCVRGFNRATRAPKPLVGRLHLQSGKSSGKGANMDA